jgi:hypothetical protein
MGGTPVARRYGIESLPYLFSLCERTISTRHMNTPISKENLEFLDFLFSKLAPIKDEIDLHDDDSCCDHIEFETVHQFCLF